MHKAAGSLSPIAGKGSIIIFENLILKFVLHVPNLSCNLFSVSKITKDSNYFAKFCDSHCEFQHQHSGRMIGHARMTNGLYYFDNNFLKGRQAQAVSSSVIFILVKDEIKLWHNKLGHPSFSYLKQLFPTLFKNLNPLIFQCKVCQLFKHHYVHFLLHPHQES